MVAVIRWRPRCSVLGPRMKVWAVTTVGLSSDRRPADTSPSRRALVVGAALGGSALTPVPLG